MGDCKVAVFESSEAAFCADCWCEDHRPGKCPCGCRRGMRAVQCDGDAHFVGYWERNRRRDETLREAAERLGKEAADWAAACEPPRDAVARLGGWDGLLEQRNPEPWEPPPMGEGYQLPLLGKGEAPSAPGVRRTPGLVPRALGAPDEPTWQQRVCAGCEDCEGSGLVWRPVERRKRWQPWKPFGCRATAEPAWRGNRLVYVLVRCNTMGCPHCDHIRLSGVIAPCREVSVAGWARWWSGTLTWEEPVSPLEVPARLSEARAAFLENSVFESGAWVTEVKARPDWGYTFEPCPMRELSDERMSAGARRALARCSEARTVEPGRALLYQDREGKWIPHGHKKWDWSAFWASEGVCHVCGGEGRLPLGHVHIHAIAVGPLAVLYRGDPESVEKAERAAERAGLWRWQYAMEREQTPRIDGGEAVDLVPVSDWWESRGFGRCEWAPTRQHEAAAGYLAKGAGDYTTKGGGLFQAAYLRAASDKRLRTAEKWGPLWRGVSARGCSVARTEVDRTLGPRSSRELIGLGVEFASRLPADQRVGWARCTCDGETGASSGRSGAGCAKCSGTGLGVVEADDTHKPAPRVRILAVQANRARGKLELQNGFTGTGAAGFGAAVPVAIEAPAGSPADVSLSRSIPPGGWDASLPGGGVPPAGGGGARGGPARGLAPPGGEPTAGAAQRWVAEVSALAVSDSDVWLIGQQDREGRVWWTLGQGRRVVASGEDGTFGGMDVARRMWAWDVGDPEKPEAPAVVRAGWWNPGPTGAPGHLVPFTVDVAGNGGGTCPREYARWVRARWPVPEMAPLVPAAGNTWRREEGEGPAFWDSTGYGLVLV